MNEVAAEHRNARPLEVEDYRRLVLKHGVPPRALTHSWADDYATVERDRVVIEGGRFEFARYRPEAEADAVNAYTLPLFDDLGDHADILAFRPDGAAATWLGRVPVAGEEQLFFTRGDEPLDVQPTVLEWLRAQRRGLVILDHRRAAWRLDGVSLRTATANHARRLRAALARPAPRIVVAPTPLPIAA